MNYRSQYQQLLQKNQKLENEVVKLEKMLADTAIPIEALVINERHVSRLIGDNLLEEFERVYNNIRKYIGEKYSGF